MTELLTTAQMRAIEQAAIESGAVTGLELMERAGRGVVNAVFEEWPELAAAPHKAVVLCGPGNNGGDGFVVARRLRDKGWQVEVLFGGQVAKLPPDARKNYDVWHTMGDVLPLDSDHARAGLRPDLLVDAMFGTGLTRAISLEMAKAYHAVAQRKVEASHSATSQCKRVAVDCPSGMDSDSGRFLLPQAPEQLGDDAHNDDLWARWWADDASKRLLNVDLTLSFHRRKTGHALNGYLGKVRVVDIGLGRDNLHPVHLIMPRQNDKVVELDFDRPEGRSRRIWPRSLVGKSRNVGEHKYTHGHALILSGGSGRTGAARLAARGALRIGAGLVTLGVPSAAQMEVASQITAVMLTRAETGEELFEVLSDTRINALCLGPGHGLAQAREMVPVALEAERACVLDADALSAFSDEPDRLFHLLHENCVLTPHGGEFAKLFPDIAEKLNAPATFGPAYSKVDATREAAKRAGCIVLFKGADTVIAASDGRCSINAALYERAAPWLATAGSGDVLAGFITGLLARGLAPMQAAETGAWLHVECALSFGPGLIAEDLPEELPKVFRTLKV